MSCHTGCRRTATTSAWPTSSRSSRTSTTPSSIPKNFDPRSFVDIQADVCIVPPNSFALGRTIEYFRIPRDILTICLGKSTYARCGIIVNVTPFEPEWEGFVTLEISNTTPLPAKIYANEGIAQVLFLQGDEPCERSYADKKGKYLKQTGVTLPKYLVGPSDRRTLGPQRDRPAHSFGNDLALTWTCLSVNRCPPERRQRKGSRIVSTRRPDALAGHGRWSPVTAGRG